MCLFFVPHAVSFRTNSNSPRGLLGPVRLRELNCITQGLRDGPWQPGFNPSQILKPVECLPSFLLLCFASQEAGKKARDD